MITEKAYREMSEEVYLLDPKHKDYDSTLKKGSKRVFNGVRHEILDVEHISDNGMQAMTVDPNVKEVKHLKACNFIFVRYCPIKKR